ncbi:MAG: ankyrin repeat domain-containing protein [Rickettsiales bacterium]|nr:ankyrin repeat domain-containing protein [Rickettsiales bacterium]
MDDFRSLFEAIYENNWGNFEQNLKVYSSKINDNYFNYTPLTYAIVLGRIEMAKFLVFYGANVDLNDHGNRSPLFLALLNRVDELVDEIKIKSKNFAKLNKSVLDFAVLNDQLSFVHYLRQQGVDISSYILEKPKIIINHPKIMLYMLIEKALIPLNNESLNALGSDLIEYFKFDNPISSMFEAMKYNFPSIYNDCILEFCETINLDNNSVYNVPYFLNQCCHYFSNKCVRNFFNNPPPESSIVLNNNLNSNDSYYQDMINTERNFNNKRQQGPFR